MLRAFFAGVLISLAGMAHAEPVGILSNPSDTLTVVSYPARMTVSFERVEAGYSVRMSFLDPDGETMHGRVILVDGQSHEVSFTDEERGKRLKFRFERAGILVGVHLTEDDFDAKLAGNADQSRLNVK